MIITSPPYDDLRDYEGKINWNFGVFKVIAEEMYRIMKKKAASLYGWLEIRRKTGIKP